VHLVGFIITVNHNARSAERQIPLPSCAGPKSPHVKEIKCFINKAVLIYTKL